MIGNILKTTLATVLDNEGNKRINRDTNDTGPDDASGRAFKAIAAAINVVDLSTANKQTFKNMARAFRAAADQLDAEAEKF